MRKALPITVILLLLTLSMTPFATAQQENIINNATNETLYVISSTNFGAEGDIPAGYRTSGWKAIAAGGERSFWAYDPHKIHFQIWKGNQPIKPDSATQTLAFWINRDANFDIVTRQEINADITRQQLLYSSSGTTPLTHHDGFIEYDNNSNITVTNAWVPVSQRNTTVNIPDPALRADIEEELDKNPGATITEAEMLTLTTFITSYEAGIADLTGLETAENLQVLALYDNNISDISALADLTNLTELTITNNNISNISALADLTNLTRLILQNTNISDISALADLTNLTTLGLQGNNISNISALANLTNLEWLRLNANNISDISPLADLTNLNYLSLDANNISNISALANLTNLENLYLEGNNISNISALADLTNLIRLDLGGNNISNISALSSLTNLTELQLSNNNISDFSPIAGLISSLVAYSNQNQEVVDPQPTGDPPTPSGPQDYTTLQGHTDGVNSVAFSPDGQTLASASYDDTIRLWDVDTGESLKILTGHTYEVNSVSFSPDGQTLASGSTDNTVRLWDVSTGETLRTLRGHTIFVLSVAFSPDGQTLASGSRDTTIRLWDVSTGETLRTLRGHADFVHSVSFSPDGQMLASGSSDNTVRLWDISTGETLRTLQGHTFIVRSVAFSPEGQTLASGSADRTIRLWDVATGRNLNTLRGDMGVLSVAFSPNRDTLASGSRDNTVRLWDISTGETLRTLQGHTVDVSSVAFSPDGQTLASGSADRTIRLWNLTPTDVPPIEPPLPPPLPETTQPIEGTRPWDVNEDGQTTLADLILVVTDYKRTEIINPRTDVNGDGTVDEQDIVLVARHLEEPAAAAAPANSTMPDGFAATTLQEALNILQAHNDGSFAFQRSITYLERLLASLTPEKTVLLSNYPNPFNPETWIPYHLAAPADVTLTIYAIDGTTVRRLDLGHQGAGFYQSKSRAAHWDGKNNIGERVASGVYFYTLKAGDFAATRKMLIRK